MSTYFQTIFTQLESQRSSIMALVSHLDDHRLNRTPGQGKWSIAQILSHIISAEQLSLRYMQKKILGIEKVKNSGFREEIKMNILKISQRMPGVKFKAPKGVIENTPLYGTLAIISAEWNKTREEMKKFLEAIPEHQVKKLIYKHPIAGYLNAGQGLLFFREHIIHHSPQIKRLVIVK